VATAIEAGPQSGSDVLRLVAAVAVVAIAAAAGLADVWHSLHVIWATRYGPYEHGYLVLAMAIWIAVVEWRRAPVSRFAPSWLALAPLALAVGALTLMEMLYINSTRLILIPPIVLGVIWAVLGWPAARRLLVGVLFLYFALPQWWAINGALQSVTIEAVATILRWTSIPAYIFGNEVLLPSGGFEIASGCSGLNYLMAGTALTAFFALTRLTSWRNRMLLVGIGAVAAVLFNWLRVFLVILVGYLSEMQHYLVRVEHHTLGWVMFLVLFVPIVIYGMRLERREQAMVAAPDRAESPTEDRILGVPAGVVGASVLAALILLLPLLPAITSQSAGPGQLSPLPDRVGGYTRVDVQAPAWLPQIANAETELAAYESNAATIVVFRGGFPAQDSGHRLISGGSRFVGDEFRTESVQVRSITSVDGEFQVAQYRDGDESGDRVILGWFEIGSFRARTRLGAKLLELPARFGGRSDAWYIAVSSACTESCDAAALALDRFLAEAAEELRAGFTLPQPGE
jgi:EpsI family protein